MDSQTGEVFYGLNRGIVPEDLHPLLRDRLNAYLERTGGITPERYGVAGSHSEIMALDKALTARELATQTAVVESDLSSFILHNRSLVGENRVIGVPPPCVNCDNIIYGVRILWGKY
jgi:hypothetical protein